jgi:hypothetical protein
MADHYADYTPKARQELTETGTLVPPENIFSVTAADVLAEAWVPGEVSYRTAGKLIEGELLTIIHKSRAKNYLHQRTEITTNGFPWNQSHIALLPEILKKTESFNRKERRGRASKFVWDHIGHERNQAKWFKQLLQKCPLCEGPTDDMQHIAVECSNGRPAKTMLD